jgi:hypothetical protein
MNKPRAIMLDMDDERRERFSLVTDELIDLVMDRLSPVEAVVVLSNLLESLRRTHGIGEVQMYTEKEMGRVQ